MKKILYLSFFIAFLGSRTWAGPWAIVVNSQSMNINTIDLGEWLPKVYGPFLTGSLGSPGNLLLDVAIIPDSNYALVSNFRQHKVYRINISDPTNPILAGALDVGPFAPGDIAISPNGQFAVISSGRGVNTLVFIDLSSFSSYSLYTLASPNGYANAVDVGKDNSTIIMCDYDHSRIIYGQVNAALSGLVSESSLPTDDYPINVAISPDGSTVLVAITGGSVGVFEITGPGALAVGSTPKVTGFHDSPQSIAFSESFTPSVVCNSQRGSLATFSWLKVNSPGNVTMGGERAANLFGYSGEAYYGVDVLDGIWQYLIAGNPSGNSDSRNRVTFLYHKYFPFYSAWPIDATQSDAAGVAIFSEKVFAPLNASLSRLTNNYIFYKEYINSLTWQANPKNLNSISKYRIYRKAKDAADSSYQQLTEVDAPVFQYNDRRLKKKVNYTYRIAAFTNRGLESAPVEVGNGSGSKRIGVKATFYASSREKGSVKSSFDPIN